LAGKYQEFYDFLILNEVIKRKNSQDNHENEQIIAKSLSFVVFISDIVLYNDGDIHNEFNFFKVSDKFKRQHQKLGFHDLLRFYRKS
jgi:hypothetical protein